MNNCGPSCNTGGILNPDGTPFKASGTLQQFNPNNPNHLLFNKLDSEVIRLGGSPLLYYECLIQFQTMDKLYFEDRGKLWAPIPVTFYGTYEPIEPENPSTVIGVEGGGDLMFECNYRAVWDAVGHMPKWGSRIHTPHMNENWVVVNTRVAQFNYWGVYHLQIICERFRESLTTGESEISQAKAKPGYSVF